MFGAIDFGNAAFIVAGLILFLAICALARLVVNQRVEMYGTCDIEADYLEHKARHEGE